MSMWITIRRISADGFAKVKADADLLRRFMEEDEAAFESLGIDADRKRGMGFDFGALVPDHAQWVRAARQDAVDRGLDPDEMVERRNPFTGATTQVRRYQTFPAAEPELARDLGCAGELDYDVGYGPARFIEPASVAGLVDRQPHMDDDDRGGVERAAASGDYLICCIT